MRQFWDIQLRWEIFGIAWKDIILIPEAGQNVSASSTRVVNVADPINAQDALTLNYFDNNQLTVGAWSANYLTISGWEINISALAITDVTVDGTSADLATFISTGYTGGNELQEWDTLILTVPAEAYIHNGWSAWTAADFTLIETPWISDSAIRALFSWGNGIDYNAASWVITVDLWANGWLWFDWSNALVINWLADYTTPTGTNIAVWYDASNNLVIDSSSINTILPTTTASNWLTKVWEDVRLWWAITESTTISSITDVNKVQLIWTGLDAQFRASQFLVNAVSWWDIATLSVQPTNVNMWVDSWGWATINRISFTDTNALVRAESSWALKYFDDYSSSFVDRSIVDKQYVDNAISAAPTWTLQQVLDSGNTASNTTMSVTSGTGWWWDGSVRLDINAWWMVLRWDTNTLNTYGQLEVTGWEMYFSRINASAPNKLAKRWDAYFEYISPNIADFTGNTLVHKDYVDNAIAAASSTFRDSFIDWDLTSWSIAITHNLWEQYVQVMVIYADKAITPDDITFDSTTGLTIDVSSFTGLTGTFNVVITA